MTPQISRELRRLGEVEWPHVGRPYAELAVLGPGLAALAHRHPVSVLRVGCRAVILLHGRRLLTGHSSGRLILGLPVENLGYAQTVLLVGDDHLAAGDRR